LSYWLALNGTEENDWPAVAELAAQYPDFITPSFGLHPWKVGGRSSQWKQLLREFLVNHPEAGLGECGLDRWIPEHDIEDQLEVFRFQLDLALELNRPVTIHCLKAWGSMMDELRSRSVLPRFLMHSFNGSLEISRELVTMGAYFSFSGYFLHDRKSALCDVFRTLPPDRILLETDAPDMLPPEIFQSHPLSGLNHPANLTRIAEGFNRVIDLDPHFCSENCRRFFHTS